MKKAVLIVICGLLVFGGAFIAVWGAEYGLLFASRPLALSTLTAENIVNGMNAEGEIAETLGSLENSSDGSRRFIIPIFSEEYGQTYYSVFETSIPEQIEAAEKGEPFTARVVIAGMSAGDAEALKSYMSSKPQVFGLRLKSMVCPYIFKSYNVKSDADYAAPIIVGAAAAACGIGGFVTMAVLKKRKENFY